MIVASIIIAVEQHMTKQPDEGWREHALNNMLPRMEAAEPAAGFTPGPANPQSFSAGVQLQPQFDVIDVLPERAAELLRKLRLRATEAHLLVPAFDQIREASMARIEAEML